MNLPTYLTFVRIITIPFVAIFYYLPFPWAHEVSAIIFLIGSATDWLDGFLARRMMQTTKLGAFLDPVADKLLVVVILILILGHHQVTYISLAAAIIIGREITISALREWMAELGKRAKVSVIYVAKIKTNLQMIALALLLWYDAQSPLWVKILGITLLYVAAILTLWSMLVYLKLAWPDLTSSSE